MRLRVGGAIIAVLSLCLAGWAMAGTWKPFYVEVGKSKLVRLQEDQKPAVVFVGNPFVADVIIERSGVVFVLGREPGETDVWILDDDGNALMHRTLIVTALHSRQISVFRGPTQEQTLACNPRCSTVVTPIGDERGQLGQASDALFANPPPAQKSPSTEELIESLRELIPELGKSAADGGKGGSGGNKTE